MLSSILLNQMYAHNLLRISKLFDQQSFFRISKLSFIFTWNDEKTEDRAKVFTSSLFEGLLINNTVLQDI